MKRVVGTALGLAAVVVVLLFPAVLFGVSTGDEAGPEETTIRTYVADFQVGADGSMDVVETLTVHFPGYGKHGIFRFWDRNDPSAPHARRDPRDITVTMDGSPESFDVSSSRAVGMSSRASATRTSRSSRRPHLCHRLSHRRRAEPGAAGAQPLLLEPDPGRLAPGDRQGRSHGAPAGRGAGSSVRWARARRRVQGSSARAHDTLISTGPLPPETPVKVGTADRHPAETTLDRHGQHASTRSSATTCRCWSLYCCSAVCGAVGLVVARGAHEQKPAFPLQYAPPDGLGPAEAVYVVTERVDSQTFVASLL